MLSIVAATVIASLASSPQDEVVSGRYLDLSRPVPMVNYVKPGGGKPAVTTTTLGGPAQLTIERAPNMVSIGGLKAAPNQKRLKVKHPR